MRSVREWLEQLELTRYEDVFERDAVDITIAKDLTQEDLRELGVELLGHRKVLLGAIAALEGTQTIALQAQSAGAERRQLTVMLAPPHWRRSWTRRNSAI